MNIKSILFLGCVAGLLACEKDHGNGPKDYSISGKAQKGPFISGTMVTLNELNASLGQTGKSFTTSISEEDGSFEIKSMELESPLCLLTASGFYFSELYGESSGAPLSLQAVSDLEEKESVNINVLTHLIKDRIVYLVSEGSSFQEANARAKGEMLTFLGSDAFSGVDFEDMDISEGEDYNAVLLAASVMLQRFTLVFNEKPQLTAELTQLLSKLGSDFREDGLIEDQKLIDALLLNISQLQLTDIRRNVESKYAAIDPVSSIPDFEKYIARFQEKHSNFLYSDFTYPDSASPEPVMSPESKLPNILVPADTLFDAGGVFSMAAIVPLNSSLTIKFIGENGNNSYAIGGAAHGWVFVNDYPHGFTLNSQRQNELMTLLFHLENPGSATIEYYENSAETPSFTKKISWVQKNP